MALTTILGISAYYHDSAACLLVDGEILGAAQEERFTRRKNEAGFPKHAVDWCLDQLKDRALDHVVDHVVFYDKPLRKFERLIETYVDTAPWGFSSFLKSMPVWLREKLWMREQIAR